MAPSSTDQVTAGFAVPVIAATKGCEVPATTVRSSGSIVTSTDEPDGVPPALHATSTQPLASATAFTRALPRPYLLRMAFLDPSHLAAVQCVRH
jgi:hypothetical protein